METCSLLLIALILSSAGACVSNIVMRKLFFERGNSFPRNLFGNGDETCEILREIPGNVSKITEEHWRRQDAAQLIWEGLGIGGGTPVGNWSSNNDKNKVLLGIGGGHYVPRHMDIVQKDGVWVGHLLSGYSLPMEDPTQPKGEINAIGGTWRQSIKVAFEATKEAFPGGDIMAHLDQK
ncbi:hypothetical protein TEA_015554 [Camellia sinensis var. sinensis]|uniref:D-aminoacyl-tRNA deacylase n=1 Tax=Camellia sinensis var. sinensis TaxID=542762 RepID=A0A4S4CXT0_CAMSN|nr:hypothetical protein TEA_015554 [Camellia sinensis var. sinensis]